MGFCKAALKVTSSFPYMYMYTCTQTSRYSVETAMKTGWLRRGNVGLCTGVGKRGDGLVGNSGIWAGGNEVDTPPESRHLEGCKSRLAALAASDAAAAFAANLAAMPAAALAAALQSVT